MSVCASMAMWYTHGINMVGLHIRAIRTFSDWPKMTFLFRAHACLWCSHTFYYICNVWMMQFPSYYWNLSPKSHACLRNCDSGPLYLQRMMKIWWYLFRNIRTMINYFTGTYAHSRRKYYNTETFSRLNKWFYKMLFLHTFFYPCPR